MLGVGIQIFQRESLKDGKMEKDCDLREDLFIGKFLDKKFKNYGEVKVG